MEFLIFICVIGLGLYFLNQNKTEKKDQTTITHKRTVKTEDGEVHIERRQTIDSVQTKYTQNDFASQIVSNTLNSIGSNNPQIPQPQPQPQPQPVQQNLIIDPMVNEQTSFLFDECNSEKSCPNCEKTLSFSAFRKSSKHPDGLTKWCSECLNTPRESNQNNKKYCPNCKKTRLKTSFYKNSKREDGLTKWCKTCMDGSKR